MNICLFNREEIGVPLQLKDKRAEHLLKILHKKEGDSFNAGITGGKSGAAVIEKITADGIYFSFKELSDGKKLLPLKLIIGFPRPIQLKRLLRDVAALGVCEVHLTGTELGEKSYMKSTLVEKGSAYNMLLDGTVQAGSTFVPELFLHQTFKECLLSVCSESKGQLFLGLDNISPSMSLNSALEKNSSDSIVAAIGSERGWTDKERTMMVNEGFILCSMGERIMRTETAATVASSIILNKMGYLS